MTYDPTNRETSNRDAAVAFLRDRYHTRVIDAMVGAYGATVAYVFGHLEKKRQALVGADLIGPYEPFYFRREELADVSHIPEKTIRNAIKTLKDDGILITFRDSIRAPVLYYIKYTVLQQRLEAYMLERGRKQNRYSTDIATNSDGTAYERQGLNLPLSHRLNRDPNKKEVIEESKSGKRVPSEPPFTHGVREAREVLKSISSADILHAMYVVVKRDHPNDPGQQIRRVGMFLNNPYMLHKDVCDQLGTRRFSLSEHFKLPQYEEEDLSDVPREVLDEYGDLDYEKVYHVLEPIFHGDHRMIQVPALIPVGTCPNTVIKQYRADVNPEAPVVYTRREPPRDTRVAKPKAEPTFGLPNVPQDTDAAMIHWRSLKKTYPKIPQPKIGSKEYERCLELFGALRRGQVGVGVKEYPIDMDFADKHGIHRVSKRWNDHEIKAMLNRIALLFDPGYLPQDKSKLFRALSSFIYYDNGYAKTSQLLSYAVSPPLTLAEITVEKTLSGLSHVDKQAEARIIGLIQSVRPGWEPQAQDARQLRDALGSLREFFDNLPKRSVRNLIEEALPSYADMLEKFFTHIERNRQNYLWPTMNCRAFNRKARAFEEFAQFVSKDWGVSFKTGDLL